MHKRNPATGSMNALQEIAFVSAVVGLKTDCRAGGAKAAGYLYEALRALRGEPASRRLRSGSLTLWSVTRNDWNQTRHRLGAPVVLWIRVW